MILQFENRRRAPRNPSTDVQAPLSEDVVLRHVEALQALTRTQPRLARAILGMTDRLTHPTADAPASAKGGA